MSGAKDAGWVVTCPALTVGPFRSRGTAERRLAEIVRLGACREDHVVERAG